MIVEPYFHQQAFPIQLLIQNVYYDKIHVQQIQGHYFAEKQIPAGKLHNIAQGSYCFDGIGVYSELFSYYSKLLCYNFPTIRVFLSFGTISLLFRLIWD